MNQRKRTFICLILSLLMVPSVFPSQVFAAGEKAETQQRIYLSDTEWKSWKMYGATSADENPAYTPSRNCNEAGGVLTIAGKEYQKGLRTHPDAAYPAEIVYDISGYDFTTFSATVGKDSAAEYGYGYVQFLVYVDNQLRAASPLMEADEDCDLACSVAGGKELKLVLTNGGDVITHDSGGWGNAMLDNRSCTLEDSGLIRYLARLTPNSATDGVTAKADDRTITLAGGAAQSATYPFESMYKHFSTEVINQGEVSRTLSVSLGDTQVKAVTVNPGEKRAMQCLLPSGEAITLSADGAAAGLVLKDAAFLVEAPEESYAPPAKPAGTAAAKFDSWQKDLSTLPVSFVYDDIKYFGLAGDAFTEIDRKTASNETAQQTVVTVRHLPSGADITWDAVFYPEYDAYEWTLYFTNNTSQNTGIFSNIRGAEVYFYGGNPVLNGLNSDSHGGSSLDYYTKYQYEINKRIYFESYTGKSTFPVFPYYNLTTDEGGAYIAVSWGGRYYNTFEPCEANGEEAVRFTSGQLDINTYLAPGETLRTPMVAFVEYDKETTQQQAPNLWRKWFIDCNMRKVDGELLKPMVTASSSWIYTCMVNADEESQIQAIQAYLDKGIQLDYWWMDAGWYYGPDKSAITDWPSTGIWAVDRERFPSAFELISAYADAHGMRGTILWFEPERSAMTADQIRTVFPEFKDEWLLQDTRFGINTHFMLNIGNAECREWITKIVVDIMETGGIDIYRQDFNWLPYSLWQSYDTPDRTGMVENLYVQGYYAYFDSLIEHFPDLVMDTCASGGGRLELETLRRAVPLHRTDCNVEFYNQGQAASQALYNWIPFSGQPTNYSISSPFDVYGLRSVYAPSITLNYDYRRDDLDWDLLAALVEECRMVTQYCYDDYYELTPWNNSDKQWRGWEFFNPEKNAGVIQLFCPENASELSKTIRLYGLNPDVSYVLTDVSGVASTTATGRELMESGLTINYNNVRSSSVIFIDTKPVEVPPEIREKETIWRQVNDIPDGAMVVSDMEFESWKMYLSSSADANPPYRPSFNCNEQGADISIANLVFKKGIRSHPDVDGIADIVYDISGYSDQYTTFSAYVGKDSAGGSGNIQFMILVDGKEVAQSDIMVKGEYQLLFADIRGGKKLTLRIGHGGDGITSDSAAFGLALLLNDEQADRMRASEVDGLIGIIRRNEQARAARKAYEALSDSARRFVTRYDQLVAFEAANLLENVADLIRSLPPVDQLTLDDKNTLDTAKQAYDSLTEEQKAALGGDLADTLTKALARMSALEQERDDQAAAGEVTAAIEALPAVGQLTLDDKAKVEAARSAYDALTDAQKALVSAQTLQKLEAAEAEIKRLEEAAKVTMGDIDGNGKIDAADALMALQHSVQLISLNDKQQIAADVDKNGKIDAADALKILQYSVGLIQQF